MALWAGSGARDVSVTFTSHLFRTKDTSWSGFEESGLAEAV